MKRATLHSTRQYTTLGACAVCNETFTGPPWQRYCGKRCEMRAYRERRKARETAPRCRVCGFGVDLLPVPQDAGGGHLCRYCLSEGLRRAA